ncbi:MAG: hypothetical protein P9M14_00465 [Candidatus Alcyoniella australis]|nr:hypothetical protein [Candidatus Alcyoniella australis]
MSRERRTPGWTPQRVGYYLYLAFLLLMVLLLRPLNSEGLLSFELLDALITIEDSTGLAQQARVPPAAALTLGYAALLPSALLDSLAPDRDHLSLLTAGLGWLALAAGLLLAGLSLPRETRLAALPAALVVLAGSPALGRAFVDPLPSFGLAALGAGALLYLRSRLQGDEGVQAYLGLGLLCGLCTAAGTVAAALLLLPLLNALRSRSIWRNTAALALGALVGGLPALATLWAFDNAWTVPAAAQLVRGTIDLAPWLPLGLIALAGAILELRARPLESVALFTAALLTALSIQGSWLDDAAGAALPLALVLGARLLQRVGRPFNWVLTATAVVGGLVLYAELHGGASALHSLTNADLGLDRPAALPIVVTALLAAPLFLIGLPRLLAPAPQRPQFPSRALLAIDLTLLALVLLTCLASY